VRFVKLHRTPFGVRHQNVPGIHRAAELNQRRTGFDDIHPAIVGGLLIGDTANGLDRGIGFFDLALDQGVRHNAALGDGRSDFVIADRVHGLVTLY
jgi:hypothetical protein